MKKNTKISVSSMIDDFLNKIEEATNNNSSKNVKTRRIKSLSEQMRATLRARSSSVVSFRQYCFRVRKGVKDRSIPHLSAHYYLSKLVRKYPSYFEEDFLLQPLSVIDKKVRELSREDLAFKEDAKDVKIYSEAFYIVSLSDSEYNEANEYQNKKLSEKYDADYRVGIHVESIQNLAKRLLADSNLWNNICGVALSTGRRLNEVIATGDFKKIDQNKLDFSGTLKGGDEKRSQEVEIYTLVHTDLVMNSLEKIRNNPKLEKLEKTAREKSGGDNVKMMQIINNSTGANANRYIKQILSVIDEKRKWVFRDTREIWALCAPYLHLEDWKNQHPGEGVSDFLKEQLMHESYKEQMHYRSFTLSDQPLELDSKIDTHKTISTKYKLVLKSKDDVDALLSSYDSYFSMLRGVIGRDMKITHQRVKGYFNHIFYDEKEGTFVMTRRELHKSPLRGGLGLSKDDALKYWDIITDDDKKDFNSKKEADTVSQEE